MLQQGTIKSKLLLISTNIKEYNILLNLNFADLGKTRKNRKTFFP